MHFTLSKPYFSTFTSILASITLQISDKHSHPEMETLFTKKNNEIKAVFGLTCSSDDFSLRLNEFFELKLNESLAL